MQRKFFGLADLGYKSNGQLSHARKETVSVHVKLNEKVRSELDWVTMVPRILLIRVYTQGIWCIGSIAYSRHLIS